MADTADTSASEETLRIAKTFVCQCGTLNKFEFETNFGLHSIKINVRCQVCGVEKEISLDDFVKLQSPNQTKEITEEKYDTFEEESAYADLFGRVK